MTLQWLKDTQEVIIFFEFFLLRTPVDISMLENTKSLTWRQYG